MFLILGACSLSLQGPSSLNLTLPCLAPLIHRWPFPTMTLGLLRLLSLGPFRIYLQQHIPVGSTTLGPCKVRVLSLAPLTPLPRFQSWGLHLRCSRASAVRHLPQVSCPGFMPLPVNPLTPILICISLPLSPLLLLFTLPLLLNLLLLISDVRLCIFPPERV